jgi:hypothetical protein
MFKVNETLIAEKFIRLTWEECRPCGAGRAVPAVSCICKLYLGISLTVEGNSAVKTSVRAADRNCYLAFLNPDLPLFRPTHRDAQCWQTDTSRLPPRTDICQPLPTCSTHSTQSSPAAAQVYLEKQQRLPKNMKSENFWTNELFCDWSCHSWYGCLAFKFQFLTATWRTVQG